MTFDADLQSTNMIDQKMGSKPGEVWSERLRGQLAQLFHFILTLASVTHFVHALLVFFPWVNLI